MERKVKIFNIFMVLAIAGVASGCAMPPFLTYLGYIKTAADVGSLIETEKTLTDHALSAITEEDCVLFRVVVNKEVCRPKEEPKEADEDIWSVDSYRYPHVVEEPIPNDFLL